MSESKDEYLLWPGVFDEALARVMPAPSYMEWVQQVRQIACWANILRLGDAQAICERWSASGVNAAPADAGLIRGALRPQSLENSARSPWLARSCVILVLSRRLTPGALALPAHRRRPRQT
jgi:hypothetical protein